MSTLERVYLSIAALGLGLGFSCSSADVLGVCSQTGSQCISANLKVLTPRLCKTQDWTLKVQFINVDLKSFPTIGATLTQSSGKVALPITLQQDTPAGSTTYSATIKKADLQQFQRGLAELQINDEPGFNGSHIQINGLFSLQKVAKDYVDPGIVQNGTPSLDSFPWPERVGVRSDGNIMAVNEGMDSGTGAPAWKVLELQYNQANAVVVKPPGFFGGAPQASNKSPFTADVNNAGFIVTNGFAMKTTTVQNCPNPTDFTKCVNQCDTMNTSKPFTSMMDPNYKALSIHPKNPLIAYVDSDGLLLSANLPDPATTGKITWAKPGQSPLAGKSPGQVLLSMGNLNAANQLTPSVLAAYQESDNKTLTPAAYTFNTSGDGSLAPDMATTNALKSAALLGTQPIKGLAVGDLDGDGLDDIVFVRDGKIQGLSNWGGGSYCAEELGGAPAEVTAMAIGDVNKDGRKDLIIISKLAQTVAAYLNNP